MAMSKTIPEGWTPLHEAAKRRSLPDVLRLLENKSDNLVVDAVACNRWKSTPFAIATLCGHRDIMRALLDAGADAKQMFRTGFDMVTTAARIACERGDEKMLVLLLGFGVSASDKVSTFGDLQVLSVAARNGEVRLVRLLVEHGAEVGVLSYALMEACGHNHFDAAEYLLSAGASVQVRSGDGCTPLHHGCGNPRVVQLLLEAGAAVDASVPVSGNTPLFHVFRTDQTADAVSTIQILASHGADVNAENRDGRTPLHYAVGWWEMNPGQMADTTRALLAAGADANAVSDDASTPLLDGVMNRRTEMVDLLLGHKMDRLPTYDEDEE